MDFKANQIVIWDSRFGYEIAEFVTKLETEFYYEILLLTGPRSENSIYVNRSEVYPFTDEKRKEMELRYGHKKQILL